MTEESTITVKLATALARYAGNQKEITCPLTGKKDLLSVIDGLDMTFSGLKSMICNEASDIVDSINVYVNGDNVRYLQGLETSLNHGDTVNIIPAAAAG